MNEMAKAGFVWTIETLRNGVVIEREVVHNLIPVEGLNHILSVLLKAGAQVPTWYIGIYEGNYTPTPDLTAAQLPALAVECTSYTEATRRELVEGAVANGAVDNLGNRAEFTSNANKTVYGGFITSAPAKGSTAGVLLSAVRFPTPKSFEAETVMRVSAGFNLASL
ncbi:hypothetical protein [Caldimonas sp. KR1-144]|uniref:hypothetical protein n=1 Tax=Caldimonas sp. KR1-144 TaxID=3400911 RepID=UPI003C12B25D